MGILIFGLTPEELILLLTIFQVLVLGSFAIIRTYYQRKMYKIQGTMLKESREYWEGWKERSQDIAKKTEKRVVKKVFTRLEALNEKDSERTSKRNSGSRTKTK